MIEKNENHSAELVKLWLEYQETKKDIVREKIIENYLPLVKLVAGRVAISLPQHVDRDDLISSGFFGLLDAI
jgi:RNA polymerase sigma factor for flagellar operon FliA